MSRPESMENNNFLKADFIPSFSDKFGNCKALGLDHPDALKKCNTRNERYP
jgi:hypothetical protein